MEGRKINVSGVFKCCIIVSVLTLFRESKQGAELNPQVFYLRYMSKFECFFLFIFFL